MKERPILFSGEMVCAILEGRKTQTRRVIKPQPDNRPSDYMRWYPSMTAKNRLHYGTEAHMKRGLPLDFCSYGHPGDRLWVREAWSMEHGVIEWSESEEEDLTLSNWHILYRAGGYMQLCGAPKEKCLHLYDSQIGDWRPSIHMPRWASRINLEIVKIRVERLQDITEEDAIAEGVSNEMDIAWQSKDDTPIGLFGELWDSINEKRDFGWEINPWVWVIEFKVTKNG